MYSSAAFENRIKITSLAVMKQRCHNDFSCTFQKLLGSCRCSPPSKSPTEAWRAGRVQHVRCSLLLYTEREVNRQRHVNSSTLHVGVILLPKRDVIVSAAALVLLSSTLIYHSCPHGQLLGHLAGVRKFLSAFFH